MAQAFTSWEHLAYGKEAAWGVPPVAAGGSQLLRVTGINSANQKNTISSGEITTSLEVADVIQVQQNGGVSFATELSYGNLDDLLETLFWNAWTANVLQASTIRKSVTFERQFTDINRWHSYAGSFVTQLQLQIAMGRVITANVTAAGMPLVEGGTSVFTGGGTVAAPTNSVMDPITSLQLAQEGGSGAIAGLTELTLTISRSAVVMPQIGSVAPIAIMPGQLMVSGSFSCYLADGTYIAKALAHTTTSLAFTIGGAANKKLAFLLTNVKLNVPDVPNTGPNAPLVQRVDFTGFKDNGTNSTCKITRTP